MYTFKLKELEKGPEALLKVLEDANDRIALCEDAPLILAIDGYAPMAHFIPASGRWLSGNCNYAVKRILYDAGYCDHAYYGIYSQTDANRVLSAIDINARFSQGAIDKVSEFSINKACPSQIKKVDLGVELEIEHTKPDQQSMIMRALNGLIGNMVDMAVHDGSVRGGHEIRFNYGPLSQWQKTDITGVMKWLKGAKFNNRTSTAGMHIHMSTDTIEATRFAAERCKACKKQILDILYPICGRKAKVRGVVRLDNRYGIDKDFTRGFTSHKTLEIRVFEATLNPKVFMARLKFCDYFMRFLCTNMPFSEFFNQMSLKDKQNYAYLVKTNNQHAFGMGKDAALKRLNMEA